MLDLFVQRSACQMVSQSTLTEIFDAFERARLFGFKFRTPAKKWLVYLPSISAVKVNSEKKFFRYEATQQDSYALTQAPPVKISEIDPQSSFIAVKWHFQQCLNSAKTHHPSFLVYYRLSSPLNPIGLIASSFAQVQTLSWCSPQDYTRFTAELEDFIAALKARETMQLV